MTWKITPGQLDARDADANTYMSAVEAADGQPLELATRLAITDFVVGCKADGIWTAIKSSCILAGARTLTGALVPLVGTAPTNVSFVSGDYNRKTGLVGDGTTKYLNSNRNNNADPQDSFHMSCYISTAATATAVYMGAGPATNETGASNIGTNFSLTRLFARNRFGGTINADVSGSSHTAVGLFGTNRVASSTQTNRASGVNTTNTVTSEAPYNGLIAVFSATTGAAPANARLAFYSIGESLDLALLDTRVTTLVNALSAAIP